jgi:hypothetical protein
MGGFCRTILTRHVAAISFKDCGLETVKHEESAVDFDGVLLFKNTSD